MKRHSAFIGPDRSEWWAALRWVYLTFTILIVLTMAGSFVSYERVLTQGHPWLPAKRDHAPCSFCGMTRSFCAMSAGKRQEAWQWNHGGPVLYTAGWVWLAGTACLLGRQAWQRKKELSS